MVIIRMPAWLSRLLGASVALGGIVLAAEDPTPALLAHEQVHLDRQRAMGTWRWLWHYLVSRSFRLHEEALAWAAERSPWTDEQFARDLASWRYGWAAGSIQEAMEALNGQV